jgi:hypothetical protein
MAGWLNLTHIVIAALLLLEPTKSDDLNLKSVLNALNIDLPSAGTKIVSFASALGLDTKPVPVKLSAQPALLSDGRPASALWFVQDDEGKYQVTRMINLELGTDFASKITGWLNSQAELEVTFADDVLKGLQLQLTVATYRLYRPGDSTQPESVSTVFALEFAVDIFTITVNVTANSASILVTPRMDLSTTPSLLQLFDMVKTRLKGLKNQPTGEIPDVKDDTDPIVAYVGNRIYPWYLEIGQTQIGSNLKLDFGVGTFIVLGNDKPVVIALSYQLSSGTFSGRLITAREILQPAHLRSPTYDPRSCPVNIIKAIDNQALLHEGINLWDLVRDGDSKNSAPQHLPTWLTECWVQITKTSDGTTRSSDFTFSATMSHAEGAASVPMADSSTVPMGLSWTDATLYAGVNTVTTKDGTPKSSSEYVISVQSSFVLKPGPDVQTDEATAIIAMAYSSNADNKSSWLMTAQVEDLSVGLLASFFDKEVQDGAMNILKNLTLRHLNIAYAHTSGQASSFYIYGILQLGELELDLSYQYVSTLVKPDQKTAYDLVSTSDVTDDSLMEEGPTTYQPEKPPREILKGGLKENRWIFQAQLRTTSATSTVGSVMESIVPGSQGSLPSFVSDIPLNPVSPGSTPMADVTFEHNAQGSTLCVFVNIAGFSFTSVHFRTVQSSSAKASTKRILRFSCDKIPMMDRVPLINQLPQPFDSLQYLWVTDDQVADGKRGVTKADVDNLAGLQAQIPPLQYKQSKKDKDKDEDIVILPGHHFMVIAGGKVALDHVFGNSAAVPPRTPPSPPLAEPTTSSTAVVAPGDGDTGKEVAAKPTKGDVKLKVGPLSITAVGLQVVAGHLLITLDATLDLGAISMSVVGFAIDIDMSQIKLNDLSSLTAEAVGDAAQKLSISLRGLDVALERGPLTLAGFFEHNSTTAAEIYRGGIAVGFKAWQVLAVGEYTIIQATPTAPGYRAVFVFGKLDGPLVELEFATISGVRLGFAYNYMVRMPTVGELYRFPFISDGNSGVEGSGNDPMKVLAAMTDGEDPFVSIKEGSMWMCAGMTITAFDVLTLTAVLMLQITSTPDARNTSSGADGVVIALLADGVFQMEPIVKPDQSLFYIELVVKVEFNFVHGYVAADAALAPASHVFVPAARLTGTASFYTWFGNNPHNGDWVVSVGGYARNYSPPPHYPSNERVQLSFTVGDNIQILGSGYIAVTPRCAMAGGSLHLSLSVGPVTAYADLVLDAFLSFKPFHFHAIISLSIGVECRIDFLFIHTSISVHLGAELTLWGPDEFGGYARVNFWFFGFSIAFGGAEKNVRDPVDLATFLEMVKSPGPDSAPRETDSIAQDPNSTNIALHKWTVETGLVANHTPESASGGFPSTGASFGWDVDAASLTLRVDTTFALTTVSWTTEVDAHLKSTATKIPRGGAIDPGVAAVYAMPMHAAKSAESDLTITMLRSNEVQTDWQVEPVVKKSAPALWSHSAWTPDNDPLSNVGTPPDAVRNGNLPSSIDLVMGVRLLPPDPLRALSNIMQFDMTLANTDTVQATGKIPIQIADSAFGAKVFEPEHMNESVRWTDFAQLMNQKQSSENLVLHDIRKGIAAEVSSILEWDIRPVGASVDDPDAHQGWNLKPSGPSRLAEEVRTQWIELPFVSDIS